MMVDALSIPAGYKYDPATNSLKKVATGSTSPSSVFNSSATNPYLQAPAPAPAPEKPKEKKMGFLEGVGHFFAGAGKALGGAICSVVPGASLVAKALGWKDAPSFSLKNALIAAGTIALTIVCPPAGVALAAVGIAAGTVKVGKGVYDLATADTKEQQEAACEEMGSGALEVGVSVAGAKVGLKSCGNATAGLAEGTTVIGKVKGFGSGMLEDTTSSLARNTGKLGVNISKNLEGTTTIAEKAAALKNGVVKTASESKLNTNIIESSAKSKIGRIVKGTGKTVSETATNLKKAGFEKISENASKAKTNLDEASNKLIESTKSTKLKTLVQDAKKVDLSKADDIEALLKQMKEIDKTGLSKADLDALDNISSLTKKAQKTNAEFTKKSDLTKKYETEVKEAENNLNKVVKENGDDAAFDKAIKTLDDATAKLTKAQKAEGNGSMITGAKSKITDWAKRTTKSNLDEANKAYRSKMGMADEPLQSTPITKEQIAAEKSNIKELQKISDAADDAAAANKKLEAAQKEAKQITEETTKAEKELIEKNVKNAEKDLEKAKTNLDKVKEKVTADAKAKIKTAQEKLEAIKSKKGATPEQIKQAEQELANAESNLAKTEANTALEDASATYKSAKNNLTSLEIGQASQNLKSTFIKGSIFPVAANSIGNNDMSQYANLPTSAQSNQASTNPISQPVATYPGGASLTGLYYDENTQMWA